MVRWAATTQEILCWKNNSSLTNFTQLEIVAARSRTLLAKFYFIEYGLKRWLRCTIENNAFVAATPGFLSDSTIIQEDWLKPFKVHCWNSIPVFIEEKA